MSLAIAWIRKFSKKTEELVVVSDSRLSGGARFDSCPKIMTLPRSDSLICFTGGTFYAYPLMLQFSRSIDSYSRSKDGAMDISEQKTYAVKLFNSMKKTVREVVEDLKNPDVSFIFAGYSWVKKQFLIWKIQYDLKEKKFIAYNNKKNGIYKRIAFSGDKEVVVEAYKRLNQKGKKRGAYFYDMEPFEVVRDLLRENSHDSIGGPPQIAKVYQHMNAKIQGVYWPNYSSKKIAINGRILKGYENTDYWILNPDTLKTSKQKK